MTVYILDGPAGAGKTYSADGIAAMFNGGVEVTRIPLPLTRRRTVVVRLGARLLYPRSLDGHASLADLCDVITWCARRGDVLVDSRLAAWPGPSFLEWATRTGLRFHYLCLDTSPEVCAERIRGRRASDVPGSRKRKSTPEDEAYKSHRRLHEQILLELERLGVQVTYVDHRRSVEHLAEILRTEGALR